MSSQLPSVIGLYSSVPGSGKTTAAEILIRDYGYTHLSFAGPLKSMIRCFLQSCGYPEHAIDHFLSPEGKSIELPGLRRCTTRHLLQTLGTEWGRNCVSPDVWSQLWHRRASQLITQGHRVVADDVRFPEEAALVHSLGGELWRISRDGLEVDPVVTDHSSEGGLEATFFHRHISNSAGLDVLESVVARSLQRSSVASLLSPV
jgi:hypothetical protein